LLERHQGTDLTERLLSTPTAIPAEADLVPLVLSFMSAVDLRSCSCCHDDGEEEESGGGGASSGTLSNVTPVAAHDDDGSELFDAVNTINVTNTLIVKLSETISQLLRRPKEQCDLLG
jgi:hypothetical protein